MHCLQATSLNVQTMSLCENYLQAMRLYLQDVSRVRICIKVMRVRKTEPSLPDLNNLPLILEDAKLVVFYIFVRFLRNNQ